MDFFLQHCLTACREKISSALSKAHGPYFPVFSKDQFEQDPLEALWLLMYWDEECFGLQQSDII